MNIRVRSLLVPTLIAALSSAGVISWQPTVVAEVHDHEVAALVAHEHDDEWEPFYESFSRTAVINSASDQQFTNAVSTKLTTGELRALVVNVGTPTRAATPRDLLPPQYAQAAIRVNLMSRGMTTLVVDHFGRDVVIPDVANICTEYMTLSNAALEIVRKELSIDGYRSIDFVLPGREGDNCGWAGRGELGGRLSWNFGSESAAPAIGTIVHEWGHQYSLNHLRAIRCTRDGRNVHLADRAGRSSGQCATSEYGGAFSVMGASWANNAAAITFGERSQLAWLRQGEERRVHEGIHTLGFDGPLSLLWLQNAEGDVFQVEYVRAFQPGQNSWGFTDPFTRVWQWFEQTPTYTHPGVMIKYVSNITNWSGYPAGYSSAGYVIDATTDTVLSTDAAFRAGEQFIDPTGTVAVEVLSVGDGTAQVRVRGVPHRPGLVQVVSATATDTRGVFDIVVNSPEADPPVTHYEIQTSNNWEFTAPQTFAVAGTSGQVVIPNHTNLWTIYRIAAVSAAGRGDFTGGTLLEWSRTSRLQGAVAVGVTKNPATTSLTCVKGKRVRTVSGKKCPAGWTRRV